MERASFCHLTVVISYNSESHFVKIEPPGPNRCLIRQVLLTSHKRLWDAIAWQSPWTTPDMLRGSNDEQDMMNHTSMTRRLPGAWH